MIKRENYRNLIGKTIDRIEPIRDHTFIEDDSLVGMKGLRIDFTDGTTLLLGHDWSGFDECYISQRETQEEIERREARSRPARKAVESDEAKKAIKSRYQVTERS